MKDPEIQPLPERYVAQMHKMQSSDLRSLITKQRGVNVTLGENAIAARQLELAGDLIIETIVEVLLKRHDSDFQFTPTED